MPVKFKTQISIALNTCFYHLLSSLKLFISTFFVTSTYNSGKAGNVNFSDVTQPCSRSQEQILEIE